MSTARQKGIINFNPKYFTGGEKIISEISAGVQNGYYPKNMTIEGVGAHEAGHILEDWLIAKNGAPKDVRLRVASRKIIREAYKRTIQTAEGNGKTIEELRRQICNHACTENTSECLADAVSDCIINGLNAKVLSLNIWQIIKEELIK